MIQSGGMEISRNPTRPNGTMKTSITLLTLITQSASALPLARLIVLLLLPFAVGLASMRRCAAAAFEWDYTGSLNTAREFYSATLLPNGMVLAAGGYDYPTPLASAELYDPVTGTWS